MPHTNPRILLVASCLVACNAISGVDEFQFGDATSTAGGTTSVGGAAIGGASIGGNGTGGTSSMSSTADSSSSTGGAGCSGAGEALCGDKCTNITADSLHCGVCPNECDKDEWCVGSSCVCRNGLSKVGQACVDTQSNPANCNGATCSGATDRCENGACVAACTGGRTDCNGACVALDTNPLHCGLCNRSCDVDKVCQDGECKEYRPTIDCLACPCPSCGGNFPFCCELPGASVPFCLTEDASGCP